MAVCPNGHDSASDDFCDVCGMRIGVNPGTPESPASGPSPATSAPPTSGFWPDAAAGAGEPCPRCGTPRIGQFCEACGLNFSTSFSSPGYRPAGSGPADPATAGFGSSPAGPAGSSPAGSSPVGSSPAGSSPASSSPASSRSARFSPAQPPAPAYQPTSSFPSAPLVPPPAESAPSAPAAPTVTSMASFPYPQTTWTAVVAADRAYYERVQAVTGPEGAAVAFPSYYAERRFQLVGNQMRIGRRSVSRGLAPEIDLTGPPADPGISRLHAVLIATPDGNWAVLDPGSANGTLVNGVEITVGDQVPLRDGDRINLGAWTAITVRRDQRIPSEAQGSGR